MNAKESKSTENTYWFNQKNAKKSAEDDLEINQKKFLDIIHELVPDAIEFNPSSMQQLQQLLYAPFKRKIESKSKNNSQNKIILGKKVLKIESIWEDEQNSELEVQEDSEHTNKAVIADEEPVDVMKVVRNFKVVDDYPQIRIFKSEKLANYDYSSFEMTDRERKLKYRNMSIHGFGIPAQKFSAQGLPSVDTDALKSLLNGPIDSHFKLF